MKCNWCSNNIQPNTKFCSNCGKEVVYNNQQMYSQGYPLEEKTNVGLAILSWFIPLVGLILFITKKDREPKTAKACGLCALISFILGFIVIILLFIIPFMIGFTSAFEEDYDNENNYKYEESIDVNENDEMQNNTVGNTTVTVDPNTNLTYDKNGAFLMAVEDVFTITGQGTVVTGHIERGTIKVNDEVQIIGLGNEITTTVTGISNESFRNQLDYAEA